MKDDVILAKWLNNEMDGQELKEFEASAGYGTYNKIKEFSGQLTAPQADMDTLYQNIQQSKHTTAPAKVIRLNQWLPRIAAILVLALATTFYFYTAHTTTQIAANGERVDFLLPDESQVVLNSGSDAAYKEWNWSGHRRVELKGEAYFKAAKGEVFDVVTPLGTVTVVGTQFNVKARNNRFDVSCYEGKVKVTAGTATVMLTPGQTVAFANGTNLNLPAGEAAQPGWLVYETYFNNESLPNVISEIERQYNLKITFTGTLPKSAFTGPLPMKDLNKALDILETAYNLKATQTGKKIILTTE